MIKRRGWNRKNADWKSQKADESLRVGYLSDILRFPAEDLVFLDESIFNEKTGWRHFAYAPIGAPARYEAPINCGRTWAICAAMTIDGWLPCTGFKEGYYNTKEFLYWINNRLLPSLRQEFGPRPKVIIMDNLRIHNDPRVKQAIEAAGHIVRLLPPYSPDFDPIELTFATLKAWIRRHYYYKRQQYPEFGSFLRAAVEESRCDRFAAL